MVKISVGKCAKNRRLVKVLRSINKLRWKMKNGSNDLSTKTFTNVRPFYKFSVPKLLPWLCIFYPNSL